MKSFAVAVVFALVGCAPPHVKPEPQSAVQICGMQPLGQQQGVLLVRMHCQPEEQQK